MASLNNPVNAQNIIDRFADYVVATANAGIVWGTNARPFQEFPPTVFGGDGGRAIAINGTNITADPINAGKIYDTLLNETYNYTRIRKLQAKLNVTGGGGNTGSRPTAGVVYDQTNVANMSTAYLQGLGLPDLNNVKAGQNISSTNLENLFNTLRAAYQGKRDTVYTIQVDVCHASCHSSCHSSRGRR